MVLKAHIGWNNRVMGFFKMLFFFMFIWILLKRGNTDFVIRNKKELLKCGAKFWTHYLSLDLFFLVDFSFSLLVIFSWLFTCLIISNRMSDVMNLTFTKVTQPWIWHSTVLKNITNNLNMLLIQNYDVFCFFVFCFFCLFAFF